MWQHCEKNKEKLLKGVLNAKLTKVEMIAWEDQNGLVVLKYREVRDVVLLSLTHKPELIESNHSTLQQSVFMHKIYDHPIEEQRLSRNLKLIYSIVESQSHLLQEGINRKTK